MAQKDFKLENDFDLAIENGDFAIVESDQDHIAIIVKSYLGAFKQFPLVGLGIDYYLASSTSEQVLKRNMTVQLNNDGYRVDGITVLPEHQYFIDAIRIKNE
jgi:hypothetical protein